jgi:muramoyltetrapeptide carboxypeptidase
MCTSLEDDLEDIKASISTLKNAIFGSTLSYNLKGSKFNKPGVSSGQLIGGNLTLLHTMLGSRSSINTDGKIIFIEEIGEYAYHIDRMLISMKRAGYFENCKGIIVGDISKVRKNTTPWGKPVKQLILDVFSEYSFPILFNFPAGHEDDNRALILGRNITINVGKEESSVNYFD